MDSGINSTKRLPSTFRLVLAIIGSATVPTLCVIAGLNVWVNKEPKLPDAQFFLLLEIYSISIIIFGLLPIHFWLRKQGKKTLRQYMRAGVFMSPLVGMLGVILIAPLLFLAPLIF
jgi:hypothetical protein